MRSSVLIGRAWGAARIGITGLPAEISFHCWLAYFTLHGTRRVLKIELPVNMV